MQSLGSELEAVYEQSGPRLYACALAVTGCGGLAEDAVHNAFHRCLRLTRRPDHLQAYLFRSVRNATIDLMRRQNRSVPITADMVFECAPSQHRQLEKTELLDRVSKALTDLTDDERETIVQHLVAELTFQEIAEVQDRPLGTVTSWYRRGLKKLKTQLKDEDRPV